MEERIEKKLSRKELAKHFEELARRIREGRFSSGNRAWSVPDEIDTKIRFKEKKGRFEAKLKLRWSTLIDYDPGARKEMDDLQNSIKSIKKRMSAAYKNMSRSLKAHQFPEERDVEVLIESSQAFFRIADSDMEDAMKEFMDHLVNLKQASASRIMSVIEHEFRDIGRRMGHCHREFK
jgi:XXXCH domain-containing protein